MTRWFSPACLFVALLATACGNPPSKEMDQAQGAIDAARAAGANRYAATEFAAATDSLKRAETAVTERDYRLALNNALESREHAQNAAREAADTKARVRAEVERSMTDVATLLAEANTRLAAARRARVSSRLLRQPQEAIAAANTAVQKAGEAVKADDYLAAKPALDGVNARIQKAIEDIDSHMTAQTSRRRR